METIKIRAIFYFCLCYNSIFSVFAIIIIKVFLQRLFEIRLIWPGLGPFAFNAFNEISNKPMVVIMSKIINYIRSWGNSLKNS